MDILEKRKEECTEEDNRKIYIEITRNTIDNALYINDYRTAFAKIILTLERLNENEIVKYISYYRKRLSNLIRDVSQLYSIDEAIYQDDFRTAFGCLIMNLEELNNNEKKDFIVSYSKRLNKILCHDSYSHLRDRN